MQSPLTIVIPVYNRAHTVGRTLRSIESQTVQPARVILVDNNSSDTSLSLLHDWASVHDNVTVLTEPRPGACAARNRGLREVTTEWTMFFDSDDEMLPTHVEEFTRAISANPTADIIGRDIVTKNIDGSTRTQYFHGGDNCLFHHIFRGCMSTMRHIAKTQIYRAVNGWDESLKGWDDFELGVRILLMNPNVVKIKGAPTAVAFQQEVSLTGTDFSSHPERWEDALDAIRRLFTNLPDTHAEKSQYIAWLDARAMILAAQYEREARTMGGNAHALAKSLHDRILSTTSHPATMRLIYRHNLAFSRLTWLIAKVLL